jgi:hypothetical protein
MELLDALYGTPPDHQQFFTPEADAIRRGLTEVEPIGDEAVLVALDLCLDLPWRSRGGCHRVVVMLTDEPLETNVWAEIQRRMITPLIDKIHALGVMLFMVAPGSPGFDELSEADKCQFQQVGDSGDGLSSVDFARVLSHIGKSVSVSVLQQRPDTTVRRALFGQDQWVAGRGRVSSGR